MIILDSHAALFLYLDKIFSFVYLSTIFGEQWKNNSEHLKSLIMTRLRVNTLLFDQFTNTFFNKRKIVKTTLHSEKSLAKKPQNKSGNYIKETSFI